VTTTVEPQAPHTAAEQFAIGAVAAAANSARPAFPSIDQPIVGAGHFSHRLHDHLIRASSSPPPIGIILQQVSVIAALAIGRRWSY
jgi:hypothetical protein